MIYKLTAVIDASSRAHAIEQAGQISVGFRPGSQPDGLLWFLLEDERSAVGLFPKEDSVSSKQGGQL